MSNPDMDLIVTKLYDEDQRRLEILLSRMDDWDKMTRGQWNAWVFEMKTLPKFQRHLAWQALGRGLPKPLMQDFKKIYAATLTPDRRAERITEV